MDGHFRAVQPRGIDFFTLPPRPFKRLPEHRRVGLICPAEASLGLVDNTRVRVRQADEPGSREPPRAMIRESRAQQVQHVVQQQRERLKPESGHSGRISGPRSGQTRTEM
jgi:hypothetical protein